MPWIRNASGRSEWQDDEPADTTPDPIPSEQNVSDGNEPVAPTPDPGTPEGVASSAQVDGDPDQRGDDVTSDPNAEPEPDIPEGTIDQGLSDG